MIESTVSAGFLMLAVAGFKKNLWLVVAALGGRGVFDFFSSHVHSESGGRPKLPGENTVRFPLEERQPL